MAEEVSGVRCPVSGVRCPVSGVQCPVSGWLTVGGAYPTKDSSLIQYLWRQSGSEIIDTDLSAAVDNPVNTTLYTLRRVVDGQTHFNLDRVSRFQIDVYDQDGNTTSNTLAIRQIEVALQVLVPTTQEDEALEEVQWTGFFRPINLTRE